ncbi:L-ascorbate oxidase-like [Diachasma alloeum]|uniref:L-ascorbate oxidase-like n=1 Tax=Diachasma alloeum TaxID=454923 RepID=UPI000738262C|nr:L-ascorbate oxidase-like [Diachasma alloeum]
MFKWIVVTNLLLVVSNLSAARASLIVNGYENGEHLDLPPFPEEEDFVDLSKHPCRRPCKEHSTPMECHYVFKVESYTTMSKACYDCPLNVTQCFLPHCIPADGLRRSVQVVNRQLPGPTIEICQGDRLIVDVQNLLLTESTSLHWHGQHHRASPYMDGVPYITQCPILPGSTFRYHYPADTSGTHFWHSHIGYQRGDGVSGPLIVRPKENRNRHKHLYDVDEHIITIFDWDHRTCNDKFLTPHHSILDNKPVNFLINGLGPYQSNHSNEGIPKNMPYAEFIVEQGSRHRFRLINAGFLSCPIEISIDNHTMFIVSTDGNDIKPVKASSLVTYAGERFDFIVEMNQRVDNYWIRLRGLMDCDKKLFNVKQQAILRYKRAPDGEPKNSKYWVNFKHDGDDDNDQPVMVVNAVNNGTESKDTISIALLNSLQPNVVGNLLEPDYQFYLAYDFYDKDNPIFNVKDHKVRLLTPQLNHISMKFTNFPLLSQRGSISPGQFCNSSTMGDCKNKYCACTHVLQVDLGSVVELVLVDEGVRLNVNHPFHLHGTAFRVIAMGQIGENVTVDEIKKLDATGQIKRQLENTPLKDTVTVPRGGYTIIRFYADNPGYWLFHCHIEFHMEMGMAVIFKVGEHEEMLPVPDNFPACGDWKPMSPPEIFPKSPMKGLFSKPPQQPYHVQEPAKKQRNHSVEIWDLYL